jgi:hypothetical protein
MHDIHSQGTIYSTADCSNLVKRVRSGEVIVYTGTITKTTEQ